MYLVTPRNIKPLVFQDFPQQEVYYIRPKSPPTSVARPAAAASELKDRVAVEGALIAFRSRGEAAIARVEHAAEKEALFRGVRVQGIFLVRAAVGLQSGRAGHALGRELGEATRGPRVGGRVQERQTERLTGGWRRER